jgi:site-specific DNA recombinase
VLDKGIVAFEEKERVTIMENTKYYVAGYLRLSKEDGDKEESDSIGSQRSIIETRIKELGENFELFDLYIDDGYTGLNTDRPSFQKMLRDIENGVINAVITKDLSRLSRNSFEANYYIEIYFLERNIRYISILDNVDTYLKNSNNDMIQFKTLINDWYSKDISRKVRSGVWARKEKGLYLGAKAPYGYSKAQENKNKLVINVEQSKVVQKIFNMFDSGNSLKDIAEKLKQEKIYCPDYYDFGGAKNGDYNWRSDTIKRILRNKVYIGHTEYGKKINLSYKSKKVKNVPRENWQIIENTHEPILTKEQFERIQTKLDLRKKTKHKKYSWMLNGLVICKECGSKMAIKVIRNKDRDITGVKIVCGNAVRKSNKTECDRKYKAINEEIVNKIVISNVEEKLNNTINNEKLEEIITNQYNQTGTKLYDDNIQILQKQLEKTEKTITSLYEDYKIGIIEVDDYKRFYKAEGEKRVNLKSQIGNLIKQKESVETISKDKLLSVVKELSNIKEWDREKLSEIIYNIEIDKENNVYINYKYDVLGKV